MAAAVVRAVLAVLAVPLAPFLYREHVAVLVLLRPTKEVLLFAGFAARRHDLTLPVLVVAAVPILVGGVWLFFGLGREYGPSLTEKQLPGVAGRLLPRERVRRLQSAIEREGAKVIFIGRLAAMPSSLVAAAAGAAKFDLTRFLIVDVCGALASLALMVGLGWLLEDAYEAAGPWLTALGVAALVGVGVVVARSFSRAPAAQPAARGAASES